MSWRSSSEIDQGTGRPVWQSSERVAAIDVMRGLVLVWSFVSEAHVATLQTMAPSSLRDAILVPLTHSAWHGCRFIDLGFPAYLMLIAMSIVFSYDRRLHQGEAKAELFSRLVMRAALLFAFATLYHGGFSGPIEELRLTRIFHRLAIAVFLSGAAELLLSVRAQLGSLMAVLAGYWAVMEFVPVPGYGAGDYSPEGNLNRYIDRELLGAQTYFVLSTLGVAGTCLMGLLWGHVLLMRLSPRRTLLCFIVGGTALVNLGLLLNSACPINKHIWTPSFVVFSSGWIMLVFSLVYLLTDVLCTSRWTFPLEVLGRNPLAAFASIGLLPWSHYADLIAGDGLTPLLGRAQPVVQATVQLALWWLLMYWLYRNRLIIKI